MIDADDRALSARLETLASGIEVGAPPPLPAGRRKRPPQRLVRWAAPVAAAATVIVVVLAISGAGVRHVMSGDGPSSGCAGRFPSLRCAVSVGSVDVSAYSTPKAVAAGLRSGREADAVITWTRTPPDPNFPVAARDDGGATRSVLGFFPLSAARVEATADGAHLAVHMARIDELGIGVFTLDAPDDPTRLNIRFLDAAGIVIGSSGEPAPGYLDSSQRSRYLPPVVLNELGRSVTVKAGPNTGDEDD
jgi:hypothetical protein